MCFKTLGLYIRTYLKIKVSLKKNVMRSLRKKVLIILRIIGRTSSGNKKIRSSLKKFRTSLVERKGKIHTFTVTEYKTIFTIAYVLFKLYPVGHETGRPHSAVGRAPDS